MRVRQQIVDYSSSLAPLRKHVPVIATFDKQTNAMSVHQKRATKVSRKFDLQVLKDAREEMESTRHTEQYYKSNSTVTTATPIRNNPCQEKPSKAMVRCALLQKKTDYSTSLTPNKTVRTLPRLSDILDGKEPVQNPS
ncbi:hypothetical protein L798_11018 [Zootermopsis nevadensis]|uniref:Uncharacterized protein n=1 Tax=Zootermopsis nevadensis TaxID=136037 RepID=A0A067QXP3_ZOONE|nr:hypothetical protein L798_11018 [Zootermopsis nevadensis]